MNAIQVRSKRRAAVPYAIAAAVALAVSLPSAPAADVTATWNGGAGNWSDPSQWSSNPNFPNDGNAGHTYDAVLTAGSATLDRNITIENFTFGAALNGGFDLTANGAFNWTGSGTGFGSGSGILQVKGPVSLSGATMPIEGWLINSAGPVIWTAGTLRAGNGGTFNNQGTFQTNFDGTFDIDPVGAVGGFVNGGSFIKAAGTGKTVFAVPFINNGTVTVNSGTLSLQNGGADNGSFQVAAGATLDFSGGVWNVPAGTFSAAGATSISKGQVNFNAPVSTGSLVLSGGQVTFNAPASTGSLVLSGGTLGGTGSLTVTGPFMWTGNAQVRGFAALEADGGIALNAPVMTLANRVLINTRTANWTAGILSINNLGVFKNLGLFQTNFDGRIDGGGAAFVNNGSFVKTGVGGSDGAGATTIAIPFINTGAASVQAGTLRLQGGGSGSGNITVAPGATLNVNGPNISLGNIANNGTFSHTVSVPFSQPSGIAWVGAVDGTGDTIAAANLTADRFRQNSLTISGFATVRPQASSDTAGGASDLNALSLSGAPGAWTAKLDLTNNLLRLHYQPGHDPIATIVDELSQGYDGGRWDGGGILTSSADATHGLGYADDGSGTVTVKYALYGDANLDGKVDFSDLVALARNYSQTNASWAQGDFNYDGKVGFDDLVQLARNYGSTLTGAQLSQLDPAVRADVAQAFAQVPEPSSLSLVILAAATTYRRQRHESRFLSGLQERT